MSVICLPAWLYLIVLRPGLASAENLPYRQNNTVPVYSIKRIGPVVQIVLRMTTVPRWQLQSHGDELWIDLQGVSAIPMERSMLGLNMVPLRTFKIQPLQPRGSRVVLEVTSRTNYLVGQLGRCLIIRLTDSSAEPDASVPTDLYGLCTQPQRLRAHSAAEAKKLNSDASAVRQTQSMVSPKTLPVLPMGKVAVIDPGHGGRDAGALGPNGLTEKSLALQISLRLAEALRQRGITTLLTRQSDYFVPLKQRAEFANRNHADVFVSIHLNSTYNPARSGVEVFYLDNTTDRSTIKLAKIENAYAPSSLRGDSLNLGFILSDLRQEYKAQASAELARLIDSYVTRTISARYGHSINNLGARKGPFFVLVGTHVPSVLVECGFLSNPQEATLLASPQYQELLAEAIADAVTDYLRNPASEGSL